MYIQLHALMQAMHSNDVALRAIRVRYTTSRNPVHHSASSCPLDVHKSMLVLGPLHPPKQTTSQNRNGNHRIPAPSCMYSNIVSIRLTPCMHHRVFNCGTASKASSMHIKSDRARLRLSEPGNKDLHTVNVGMGFHPGAVSCPMAALWALELAGPRRSALRYEKMYIRRHSCATVDKAQAS